MRKNIMYTLKTALVLACVLPIAATAQEATAQQETQVQKADKEFYGKPTNWRPYDQRGINQFETPKDGETIPFEGLRIRFGAGFTQQYQNLKHENTALNNDKATLTSSTGVKSVGNKLYPLQPGFNTSQANLFTDVQLADGIRLNVTTYLSARHHNEAWVKGGYIQFDKLPFNTPFFNKLMELATIKVGHMEINYGDQHFRRTDGGQSLQNPFIENHIVDAFATEIGGEVYLQKNGLFGMLGVSNGMIKGHVDSTFKTTQDDNTKRNPSIYLKGGLDKRLSEKLRVRLSGSLYTNSSQAGSGLTLYGGDRTGSNYWMVMETEMMKEKGTNAIIKSTYDGAAFSGRYNPGFSKKITAIMLNGFVKAGGLEVFGTVESAKGRSKSEVSERNMTQLAGDVIYRFGKAENLFIGARYNTVKAEQLNAATSSLYDVNITRIVGSAGWFVTRNVLLKGEVVNQEYKDFLPADYRNGGKFSGFVIEAVVGF
jgi:hypothetical protein